MNDLVGLLLLLCAGRQLKTITCCQRWLVYLLQLWEKLRSHVYRLVSLVPRLQSSPTSGNAVLTVWVVGFGRDLAPAAPATHSEVTLSLQL